MSDAIVYARIGFITEGPQLDDDFLIVVHSAG